MSLSVVLVCGRRNVPFWLPSLWDSQCAWKDSSQSVLVEVSVILTPLEKPLLLSNPRPNIIQSVRKKAERDAWVCRDAWFHLKLLCTGALPFQTCIHHTSTHTKQSISYTSCTGFSTCEDRWESLTCICTPQTPISFSVCVCVCFHGAALYEREKEPAYWDAQARATLDAALKLRPRDHQAKNIILFLGDGRSCYHYGIYSSIHSILT